ncbi:patatin-like phospholipase family protein [Thioalkalivibrio nitratireducens]|uniref:patatin-like phospholipase family protein n=1 Tax=Thioalkalivibrio nitratireducens TaxID=186931 RepID=UPI003AB043ED
MVAGLEHAGQCRLPILDRVDPGPVLGRALCLGYGGVLTESGSGGMEPDRKPVDVALQDGGAHGALTSGVLDRLLEDARIRIASVSGTSAGAMNAVVMADGLDRPGRDRTREALSGFWKATRSRSGLRFRGFNS